LPNLLMIASRIFAGLCLQRAVPRAPYTMYGGCILLDLW